MPRPWCTALASGRSRRSWRKLHLGVDADTGRIVASTLTDKEVDDGSRVGPLLDQIDGTVASFTGDGAFDRDDVHAGVAARHPEAAVVVPPRSGAVPSEVAGTAPTPILLNFPSGSRSSSNASGCGSNPARDGVSLPW